MSQNPDKPALLHAACLLLASVGLGLASNALNPAGLRWGEANAGRGIGRENGARRDGIYRNETLYENETFSARPAPQDAPVAARSLHSTPAEIATGATTPLRSTWVEVKPLVESGRIVLVDARPRIAEQLQLPVGAGDFADLRRLPIHLAVSSTPWEASTSEAPAVGRSLRSRIREIRRRAGVPSAKPFRRS
jgi:hypothetical protein